MRIVTVMNQKGGVGKSTTVMNLAAVVALHSRVLVVDLDPGQRTLTDWAETAAARGLDLPFDFTDENNPAVLGQLRAADRWDVIFVDTPGNLEPSASERIGLVLDQTDFVLLPMEPHPASVKPLRRSISTLVEPRGLPYRAIISRVKRDEATASRRDEMYASLADAGIPFLTTPVREYIAHSDAQGTGEVVTTYPQTRQTSLAIDDFKSLALELNSIWANERQ
ncbi:ParA family protein [Clavibacter michiganensis]|uniref:ParA family protein n=1 Tax=Clavibacter michiganensis TaxID=28447 RepID=UPI000CE7E69D|nr:ParA family protein [Clavibacter michiganensis]NIY62057.1 AAA family ATPase [Clavibacter michiganensis subsp. michiganensis]PPF53432.1 ParA family protein [Clavibacter michiganensis]QIT13099.1 AAA family ATPase [Clavibacter michiganensis subsp. michiganensis]